MSEDEGARVAAAIRGGMKPPTVEERLIALNNTMIKIEKTLGQLEITINNMRAIDDIRFDAIMSVLKRLEVAQRTPVVSDRIPVAFDTRNGEFKTFPDVERDDDLAEYQRRTQELIERQRLDGLPSWRPHTLAEVVYNAEDGGIMLPPFNRFQQSDCYGEGPNLFVASLDHGLTWDRRQVPAAVPMVERFRPQTCDSYRDERARKHFPMSLNNDRVHAWDGWPMPVVWPDPRRWRRKTVGEVVGDMRIEGR